MSVISCLFRERTLVQCMKGITYRSEMAIHVFGHVRMRLRAIGKNDEANTYFPKRHYHVTTTFHPSFPTHLTLAGMKTEDGADGVHAAPINNSKCVQHWNNLHREQQHLSGRRHNV
jgi:hypothetical protein